MGASGSRERKKSSLLDGSDFPSYNRITANPSLSDNNEDRLDVDMEYHKSTSPQNFSGLKTNHTVHLAGLPRCCESMEMIYAQKNTLLQKKKLIDMELRRIERDIINKTSHLDASNLNRRHSSPSCLQRHIAVKFAEALNSELHAAVSTGNMMEVRRLLKKKVNVNNQNMDGQTPTMWAALAGSEESLSALISAKGDIRIRDSHGRTALFFAACKGFEKGVELLLKAKHSEDALPYPNLNGVTPLLAAVENGHNSAVSLLLEKHLEVMNSDIPPDVNRNKWKHARSVDRRNIYGETPLILAATQGDPKLIELLLKAKSDVNARDKWGYTSLTEAVELGNLECVMKLISSTADVNCVTTSNPRTAIRIAVEASDLGILSVLLRSKADPNKYALSYSCSPLHTACESPNQFTTKVVTILVQNNADVNARNHESGQTPLHIVAQQGDLELCELLIKYGAKSSLEDNNRQTPLSLASNAGKPTTCTILKRLGAKMPKQIPEYIHKFPRSIVKSNRNVSNFKRVLNPCNFIDCTPTIGDPIRSIPFYNHKLQNSEKTDSLHERNSSFFYACKTPAMSPGILESPKSNFSKLNERGQ